MVHARFVCVIIEIKLVNEELVVSFIPSFHVNDHDELLPAHYFNGTECFCVDARLDYYV